MFKKLKGDDDEKSNPHTTNKSRTNNSESLGDLFKAIKNHDISKVKLCVDQGIDVNQRNAIGMTPLSIAIRPGQTSISADDLDIIRLLLKAGSYVTDEPDNWISILQFISMLPSNIEVLRILLANLKLVSEEIITEEDAIKFYNSIKYKSNEAPKKINAVLEKIGVNISSPNIDPHTAINIIRIVIDKGNIAEVLDFLNKESLIDSPIFKVYALNIALRENNLELVKTLINDGVDINFPTVGLTPLHVAIVGCLDAARLLLEAGAKINTTFKGLNYLELAVIRNNLAAVKLLLEYGKPEDFSFKNSFYDYISTIPTDSTNFLMRLKIIVLVDKFFNFKDTFLKFQPLLKLSATEAVALYIQEKIEELNLRDLSSGIINNYFNKEGIFRELIKVKFNKENALTSQQILKFYSKNSDILNLDLLSEEFLDYEIEVFNIKVNKEKISPKDPQEEKDNSQNTENNIEEVDTQLAKATLHEETPDPLNAAGAQPAPHIDHT